MPSDCASPQRTKNASHPSLYGSYQYQIVLLIHENASPSLAAQMTVLWSEVFEASFHSNVTSNPFDSWATVIEDQFRCYPSIHSSQAEHF